MILSILWRRSTVAAILRNQVMWAIVIPGCYWDGTDTLLEGKLDWKRDGK
jgi:hypothetical protein